MRYSPAELGTSRVTPSPFLQARDCGKRRRGATQDSRVESIGSGFEPREAYKPQVRASSYRE